MNQSTEEKLDAEQNWDVKIIDAPTDPGVVFDPPITSARLNPLLAQLGFGQVHDGKLIGELDMHSDAELKMFSEALAFAGITHDACFRVGGVWMLQSIVFDEKSVGPRVICWPCGTSITQDRFISMVLGKSLRGMKKHLTPLFAAGGYIYVDLALIGIKATTISGVGTGSVPSFIGGSGAKLVEHGDTDRAVH